jgi:site-specific recombinase XerD
VGVLEGRGKAENLGLAREKEIMETIQEVGKHTPNIRYLHAIAEWLKTRSPATQRKYLGVLREFSAYVKKDFSKLQPEDCQAYIAAIQNYRENFGKNSGQVVATKARIVSACLTTLIDLGLLRTARNPMRPVLKALPKKRDGDIRPAGAIDFEKVPAMIAAFEGDDKTAVRNRCLLAILFGCGLRINEALKLNIGDIGIDRETTYLVLRETKTRVNAEQAVPDWALAHLGALVTQRAAEGAEVQHKLFVRYSKTGTPGDRLRYKQAAAIFKQAASRAGVTGRVATHFARCTAINKLLKDGVTHAEVKDFSRHQSITMVERYERRNTKPQDRPKPKF